MTGFRARGQGHHNAVPSTPATSQTGSGVLINPSVKGVEGGRNARLWLYVTNVSTSWSLQGSASQTRARRTFYPQHLVQDLLVVKGQCPNQYEYDRLVEFVEAHHRSSLGLVSDDTDLGLFNNGIRSTPFDRKGNDGSMAGIEFRIHSGDDQSYWVQPKRAREKGEPEFTGWWKMANDRSNEIRADARKHQYISDAGIYRLPTVHVHGLITEIRAGAERFKNAPEFEFGIKVTNDLLQPSPRDHRDVQAALNNYEGGLADLFYEPPIGVEGTNPIAEIVDIFEDGIHSVHDALGSPVTYLAELADSLLSQEDDDA